MIWFGALVAVTLQTAYLSPPVAMSAYYLKQVVKEWSLATIYKGMFEFMVLAVHRDRADRGLSFDRDLVSGVRSPRGGRGQGRKGRRQQVSAGGRSVRRHEGSAPDQKLIVTSLVAIT